MSFQQGLSGLNAASKGLDVIGNNIANSNTVGFKSSQAQFADVYANSLLGGGNAVGIGTQVGTVAQQFSQGNVSASSNPLDVAVNGNGFFRMSGNGAITFTRNGQFQLDKTGFIVNAQGLSLTGYPVDANGLVVPSSPTPLQIPTGDIVPQATSTMDATLNLDARLAQPVAQTGGTLTGTGGPIVFPLTITAATNDTLNVTLNGTVGIATIAPGIYNTSASLAAAVQSAINAVPAFSLAGYSATAAANANELTLTSNLVGNSSTIAVTGGNAVASLGLGTVTATAGSNNFNPNDPTSYNNSTSVTLYDTLGNPHLLSMYFVKTATPNQWVAYATADGTPAANVDFGGGAGVATQLDFSTGGVLATAMPLTATINLAAVATALGLVNGAATPLTFTMDFRGTSQFGSSFGVSSLAQNGYTSGRLAGLAVGQDGIIQGRYSNGQSRSIGQIALANFNNPQGLKPLGNNQWAEASDSGPAAVGAPSTGSLGLLQASSVEESNVDLTAELVNMITMQRAYQANAQTIKTQDSVLQTLVNLR